MRFPVKLTLIGGVVALLVVITVYFYPDNESTFQAPPKIPSEEQATFAAPEAAVSKAHANVAKEETNAVRLPAPDSNSITVEPMQIVGLPERSDVVSEEEPDATYTIDPVRLAQAELELVNNQIYEDVARNTLPTLSIQTHNPIWVLEQKASQRETISDDGAPSENFESGNQEGPLEAPESGEFGNIQPPEGEVWLRIPVEYAREYRDIMAQHADLYRSETGYSGTVTVMLWVGGQPYSRQQYE